MVSNHGGRVLDQCPATAEVLPEIAAALKGTGVKILVDGGIRTGSDVFKALALGADAVLIARPFVTAVYGAGADGVAAYTAQLGNELADTMRLCGAPTLDAITRDMVRVIKVKNAIKIHCFPVAKTVETWYSFYAALCGGHCTYGRRLVSTLRKEVRSCVLHSRFMLVARLLH